MSKIEGRVILNVGGKRFETLVDTLRKFPNTMLGAMFSSASSMAIPDDNGEYFFDRDPKLFEVILNFYRHGKIIVPANRSAEMVKEELEFFGISVEDQFEGLGMELKHEADMVANKRMCQFLEELLVPMLKKEATAGHYSYECGFVPEKYSMNNMTNMPTLMKVSDYYELFAERENRKRMQKLLKTSGVHSQWDRSEQVNITTKEFMFECFKLTVWWSDDKVLDEFANQYSSASSQSMDVLSVRQRSSPTAPTSSPSTSSGLATQ